jgi:hypothetical protein
MEEDQNLKAVQESEIVSETDAFVEKTITVGEGFQYW